MAETQVDGGSDEGTAIVANNSASGTQGDKQPSFDAAKLQSSIDALIGKVDELDARTNGLQSVKDKTTKEISGLKNQIAEYEKLKEKLGPEGALDQMELRQTLDEIKNQLSQSVSTPSGGNGQGGVVNAAQAVRDAGLDMNDPQVALLATKQYESEAEVNAAIVGHLKAKRNAPNPTQAQALADTGAPAPKTDVEALTTEYKQKVQAARGNPREITNLREEYLQKGVKTWEVSF